MSWPADKVTRVPTAQLIPYARNARTHSDAQVAQIAASITEWGWTTPILIDEHDNVIAGHGRLLAAQKLGLQDVPVVVAEGWSEAKRRAYVLADNRLPLNAGWDEAMLALELSALSADEFDLSLLGFGEDELVGLLEGADDNTEDAGATDTEGTDTEPEIDRAEELRAKWGVERGQLWQLGEHRILCGDSTVALDVGRLMAGERANLLHADPPYGMGKEKDGVENDNLYANKLDAFQMSWWRMFRPFLENNASAYIWGNAQDLWRLWYVGGLADSERMTFRNEIVWEKGFAQQFDKMESGNSILRSFNVITERCLFFMLGEQGFNNNADNYWEGWEPIRAYLEQEMKRCGWTVADLNRITGTQMGGHWVTRSQWALITEEHYSKIQHAARKHGAFKREHDELKREHDELKREFYATRAYFDNTHDNMTDVWSYPRVTGEERHGHATPKPVAMIERCLKSSAEHGGLVVEPFSGSGTTLIAAQNTGRRCYAMELSPSYVAVAIQRWADHTGQDPQMIRDAEAA